MRGTFPRLMALTLLLSLIIAACGGGTSPTSTTAPVAPSATTGNSGSADPTATAGAAAAPTSTTEGEATAPTATTEGEAAAPTVEPTATPIRIEDTGSEAPAGATVVKWFVGLGTGGSLEQVEKEQVVVDEYNQTNTDNIYIAFNVIPYNEAYNVLATQIAAGTPPDIIGPVGIRGLSFAGENLMTLDELIAKNNVDISKYDPSTLKPYQTEAGLIGLPYALYPSFIYFNKDLFDEADLPYPPQKVGEQYDGKEWNTETLRELAMQLTVDANGVAAGEEGFDPTQIVQFGFFPQWTTEFIAEGTMFGTGDLTGPNNEATIPQGWKDGFKWFYNARHVDHFVPDAAYEASDEFGKGNVWATSKLAMAQTHLWYTCCFEGKQVPNWDIAVMPSYNGKTTAKLHADTFGIMKQTKNPDAAFKVYMFLLENDDLRQLYGGLPPVIAEQAGYFAKLDEKYAPNKVTWDVALEMLNYVDIPSHEQSVPNYLKFQDRYKAFDTLRNSDPNIDIDAEIAKLESELTAIFQGQ